MINPQFKKTWLSQGLLTFNILICSGMILPSKSDGLEAINQFNLDDSPQVDITIPNPCPQSLTASPPITIRCLQVTGSTVFNQNQLEQALNTNNLEFIGKPLTQEALEEVLLKVSQVITQLYLSEGYLNSRAVALQPVVDGIAQIQVIEGTVADENIIIEGTDRLKDYVRERVKLGIGKPLNVKSLEEQLRLLRNDPLFNSVEASLRPPTQDTTRPTPEAPNNQSVLVVRVTEADPFVGNISLDNYSPPSVGSERLSLNLLYRNPTGIGDEIGVSYRPRLETIDGTYRLEFGYQAPLNPMNGTLALRGLIDNNLVVNGPFVPLNIRGNSERYEITYRQPLIRHPREELALSLGFQYFQGQTFTFAGPTPFGFGPNTQGISNTSVLTLGQDYTLRDASGAWTFRSQFRIGVDILGATSNPSPIPDGQFFVWLGQVQRLQLINGDNLFVLQLELQLTPNPLLASEQFVIGGAQSVRGYRQNVISGDNGFRLSLENRITIARNEIDDPVLILAPFLDMGAIWNAPNNPNIIIANSNFIAGLGLGLIWQPIKGLNFRIDYAPPLVNLNIRGNNIQDNGLYFSASYDF